MDQSSRGNADRVLDHLPDVGGRRLGSERRSDSAPEVFLLFGEGEVHRRAASALF